MNFINASKLDPKKIVFIDDKPNNVKSVDAALNAAGIENIEFRYGAADERVRNFDSKIASFEYHYFLLHKVFISDEKAKLSYQRGTDYRLETVPKDQFLSRARKINID